MKPYDFTKFKVVKSDIFKEEDDVELDRWSYSNDSHYTETVGHLLLMTFSGTLEGDLLIEDVFEDPFEALKEIIEEEIEQAEALVEIIENEDFGWRDHTEIEILGIDAVLIGENKYHVEITLDIHFKREEELASWDDYDPDD